MIWSLIGGVEALVFLIVFIVLAPMNQFIQNFCALEFQFIEGTMWPVFLAWIVNLIQDDYDTRQLVLSAVHISILGPFVLNLVGLFNIMMQVFQWTDRTFWVWTSVFLVLTIGGMAMQVILYDAIYLWS